MKPVVLFLSVICANAFAQKTPSAPFSVAEALSSPLPSSLVASPKGQRLAWVLNEKGVSNIWGAQGPSFTAKKLTSYASDDGSRLNISGFSPDGNFLVFSRDGTVNAATDPNGDTGMQLYKLAWSGGEPVELTSVPNAVFSPVANEIAYSQNGAILVHSLEKGANAERLVAINGFPDEISFSPDGKRLLFSSQRNSGGIDYSFIAIYDREEKQVRYLDPSVYLDSFPCFSPDGSKVAFIRRQEHEWAFTNISKKFPIPDPWSIHIYDLQTNTATKIWTSKESDTTYNATLDWLDKETVVFTSEDNGWCNLYGLKTSGDSPQPLAGGEFEVEDYRVMAKQKRVFYVTNAGDTNRRHLWSVGAKGKPKQLTKGKGIEWSPVLTTDGAYLAWLGSDARRPAAVFVRPLEGGETITLSGPPAGFPFEDLQEPKEVVFKANDGLQIHGQLFLPPASFQGKRPALVYLHGGPIRQMLLGWHHDIYYHHNYGLNQYLASQGFVVLSVNYRLGIGYGSAFRDVPDGGPRGASEYRDLLAAARFLREQEVVDANRIGLWGGSYGGLLTAHGLARNSDLFAAGVDFHGVHDWDEWQASVRGMERQDHRMNWKSSPMADVDSWSSPVLMIHADADHSVPFSGTILLVKQLRQRGVDVELLVFPDDIHVFRLHRNWVRASEATADFFLRKLGDP